MAIPSLAELLRGWRERALLTQEQLARRTGLAERTVRRMESEALRRPRSETVRLLADALDLSDAERAQFAAAARGEAAEPAVAIPRQLPVDVAGFTGRADHLRAMDSLLDREGAATTMVISAIAGTAGVGKTSIAVHWAHRVAGRFPGGQLYVNLRGFDPSGRPLETAAAIRGFLDAFGVPPRRIPTGLDAQAALFRSLIAGRRVLVVLDNARDVEQVRPLLPGTPGCLALVTSRNRLTGLVAVEGARSLTLDLMSTVEARELLARRLGAGRVAAEPEAVDEIVARCAGLPLALAIAAARADTRPHVPLAVVAGELGEAWGSLDAFEGEEPATDLRAVFSWSYRRLGAPAARLFRLLGLHPGPDIAAPAAASLAGIPVRHARPLLSELTRAHLIAEQTPGRYAFHDLLRAYATELADAHDTGDDRDAAVHRMLDHYLHTAHTAARLLNPHRIPIALRPAARGVTVTELADHARARAWLAAEHAVLVSAIRLAAGDGFGTHSWQLAWTLVDHLDRQGHWDDWIATQSIALAAAERLADAEGQAHAYRGLGRASARTHRPEEADAYLRRALELFSALGHTASHARTHLDLSTALGRQGRDEEALRHAQDAFDLYEAADHRDGMARALNAIGWDYARLGQHDRALDHCERALALHQTIGDRAGEAATWDSLGYIHRHRGDSSRSASCYGRARDLYRELGDRYNEAVVLANLGDTHDAAGDSAGARAAWQRAADTLDELGHADAEDVRRKLGGLRRAARA